MTSIRGRLLVWLMGLLTAAGLVGGCVAYVLDRVEVDRSLDGQLRQIALNTGETRAPKFGAGDGVVTDPEDAFVVTIWDESGQPRSSDPAVVLPRLTNTGFADLNSSGLDRLAAVECDHRWNGEGVGESRRYEGELYPLNALAEDQIARLPEIDLHFRSVRRMGSSISAVCLGELC
jgi:hypothetical protein